MSNIEVTKDLDQARLTIRAEYAASPERIWELWADPRQLERWWGPPGYPATVTDHDLVPGGLVRYFMTGPEGQQHHGGWRVLDLSPPRRLEIEDYFADGDGAEDSSLPVSRTTVSIEEVAPGTTRMTIDTGYPSVEALEQVLAMGMEEGIKGALGQIDDLLPV